LPSVQEFLQMADRLASLAVAQPHHTNGANLRRLDWQSPISHNRAQAHWAGVLIATAEAQIEWFATVSQGL
jgi:hypothetical protein